MLAFLCALACGTAAATPAVSIQFSPTAMAQGGTTTFQMTIYDDASAGWTSGSLVMTYPSGLVNGSPAVTYDSGCGTTVASPGANGFSISNITLATFQVCYLYVTVTSNIPGTYTAQFPAGGLTTSAGSNGTTISAGLDVVGPVMVTNTNDSGTGSLRDAINTVNSNCVGGSSIQFNITGGAAPFTIQPLTELPGLSCSMAIDAYSQPGAARNTAPAGSTNAVIAVALDGSLCSACNGFVLIDPTTTISGFAITRFSGAAIAGGGYVYGNFLGTDASGNLALGNGYGVYVGTGYAYIGDGSAAGVNLISGNSMAGIAVLGNTTGAVVDANLIGGTAAGGASFGNSGPGVVFGMLGGSSSEVTNSVIRYNNAQGVRVDSSVSARVSMPTNLIYANTGIGIDLNGDGPTLNDESGPPYDGDTGPNDLMNYPVVTSVIHSGGDTIIDGYLKTVTGCCAPPKIEVYHNSSASTAITEGEKLLGAVNPTLDANGFATWTLTVTGFLADNVSAIQSFDPCGECGLRTSEFSPKVAATNPLIVTNASDSGVGSLRYAIDFANANCTGADLIAFNVPNGGGSISVTTPLPTITCDNLVIDGFTQPGSSRNTLANGDNAVRPIALNGFFASIGNGFTIAAKSVTIRGLQIQLFRSGAGIYAATPAGNPGAQIMGNLIGIDDSSAVQSNQTGVQVPANAAGIAVGSASLGDRNVISGNRAEGILLQSGDASHIVNNYIGTNRLGSAAVPNAVGISNTGTTGTQIVKNLISGNSAEGILIGDSSGTAILANRIGVNNSGINTANGGDAVSFSTAGAFGSVGSTNAATDGNVICFAHFGVHVASTGVSILGNSIISCAGVQGIDLNTSGVVAANDSCDADSGANGLQNYPVISSAVAGPTSTAISGTLDGTGGRTFRLEFFSEPTGTPTSIGVARTYIGTVDVTTTSPPSCATPFSVVLPVSIVGTFGPDLVSATATDLSTGSTGWVSPAFAATTPTVPGAPTIGTATAGNAQATVTFTPPATDGGSTILSYTVTSSPGNITATGTSSPIIVTGLTIGTTYTFTVTATNAIGTGAASAASNAVTSSPGVLLSPPSLAFPTQSVGTTSSPQTVTLTNTGVATLTIASIAASGDFAQTNTCGGPPGTLAPGASCVITVTFSPTAAGTRSGAVTVASNAPGTPHTVTLTGGGSAFGVVSFTPPLLTFPSVNVGTTSAPQTVTVMNSGNATVTIASIAASGDFAQTNACPTTLAPTASCVVTVTFTPTAGGTRNGTITVASDAPGSPNSLNLTGTGVAFPTVTLLPPALTFATQAVGTTSASQLLTIENSGTGPAGISSIAASGDFAQTNTCGTTLAAGARCDVTVTFTPTAVGTRTGAITVTSNASGSPHTASLTGIGAAPVLTITPLALTFPARTVSTTSPAQTVTLANTGTSLLTISSIFINGDFALTTNCATTLAVSASCVANVTFTPLALGSRSGAITITDNAAGSPHSVTLLGVGVSATVPVANISPGSMIFDAQDVGSSSAPQTLLVTNAGSAPLTFGPITITGEFLAATIPPSATPPPCPTTLSPGQSCQIGVIFRPAGFNVRDGMLSITTNASSAPVDIPLTGTGLQPQPPQLSMEPSLSFGDQPIGTRSAGTLFPIRNVSTFVANLTQLSTTGDFSVSDVCTSIAAGATCSPLVTFQPSALGPRTGTLTVRTLRDANPYVVALSGNGIENLVPVAELSATTIGFGNALLGMSVTSQVVIRNVGRAPLVVSAISASGDFFTSPGCVSTIAPGASCAVSITFQPGIVGRHAGTLSVDTNAAGSPQEVDLSGTGCYVPSPSHARSGAPLCGP